MKVQKTMVHDDLKPYFVKLNILAFLHKRGWFRKLFVALMNKKLSGSEVSALDCEEVFIPSDDPDHPIRTRVYRPHNHSHGKLPALVYFHPGGHLFGCPEMAHDFFTALIARRPCVVIAPDYRKSYIQPFPAGFNDCYTTLLWTQENADSLKTMPNKIIVAGHSAGGGLAAAVSLKARDTGEVDIAFQMPLYPMIDDTQPADSSRSIQSPVWDSELNQIGWTMYLARLVGEGKAIPSYAAPARNQDFSRLPPAITFVGNLEPFHAETVSYFEKLQNANIDVSFKEFTGCFHAFDLLAPDAGVSDAAKNFVLESYDLFYEKYIV